ncbi:hypothetical protein X636_18385 [Pandoraea pnomenusa]|nr:hypothetical protein X636_18385 [Pandoraea pnomenusa]
MTPVGNAARDCRVTVRWASLVTKRNNFMVRATVCLMMRAHTMRQPDPDAAMKTLLLMIALTLCLLFLEQAWLPSAQADECGNLGPAQTLQCAAYGAGSVAPE